MSKADEMFEKLGYKKIEESKRYLRYSTNKRYGEHIDFELKLKQVRCTRVTCQGNTHFRYFTMQELQAINEKVKELRLAKQLKKTKSIKGRYKVKVRELVEKLSQMEQDREVIIRFGLDKEDEIGYVLIPAFVGQIFEDEVAIYAEYTVTKEDCDFIGQVDLKEAYKKARGE